MATHIERYLLCDYITIAPLHVATHIERYLLLRDYIYHSRETGNIKNSLKMQSNQVGPLYVASSSGGPV